MISVSVCSECKGKGTLIIKNAYKPESKEEVFCDYCEGTGTFSHDWGELTGATDDLVQSFMDE